MWLSFYRRENCDFVAFREICIFLLASCFNIALSPSGEIGRHSGLKIRRLPEKGRTGSIPVSGTKILLHPILYHLKTRIFTGIAGFLLSHLIFGECQVPGIQY